MLCLLTGLVQILPGPWSCGCQQCRGDDWFASGAVEAQCFRRLCQHWTSVYAFRHQQVCHHRFSLCRQIGSSAIVC